MSARKFEMNTKDKFPTCFMRKLELWVGEEEFGPHEFEQIGATWSESGMV